MSPTTAPIGTTSAAGASEGDLLTELFLLGISLHHLTKKSEKLFGLSLVQRALLHQLRELPGSSAQDLARAVGVHPSTLTQTLKRLQRKGYVHLSEDPRDSRRRLISLTRSGRDALAEVERRLADWLRRLRPLAPQVRRLRDFCRERL